jgi:RNA polymerase sigma-70 factor, ECF subfamily
VSTLGTSTLLLRLIAQSAGEDAWRRFYARCEPVLLAVIRRAGFSEHDAQDILQEVMAACLESLRDKRYDPAQGRLRAWVRGIATNKIHEARRRRARPEVQIADPSDATGFLAGVADDHSLPDVFEEEWERAVMAECQATARRQVDGPTYRAFELYALEDWPVEKVAEHLKLSTNAVYIAKSRVLTRLRQLREEIESSS